jgi:flagellum-specific ATP synthase
LISVGAYRRGASATVDAAIDLRGEIDAWLLQRVDEPSSVAEARAGLVHLMRRAEDLRRTQG